MLDKNFTEVIHCLGREAKEKIGTAQRLCSGTVDLPSMTIAFTTIRFLTEYDRAIGNPVPYFSDKVEEVNPTSCRSKVLGSKINGCTMKGNFS